MKTGGISRTVLNGILFLCLIFSQSITSAQTYDLEYIYTKNSTDQEYPSLNINLVANLSEFDISQVSKIHVEAVNEFEGSIDNISLVVEPKKGYHIKDSITGSIIDQHLTQDLDFDKATEMIKIHLKEADIEIHPKLFVYEQLKQIKIQLPPYPSKEVSLNYSVFVEMNSGESTRLKINKIDTMIK